MVELLFASHNAGKIKEIQALLSPIGIHVASLSTFNIPDQFEVEETGRTFAENAELKARGFAAQLPPNVVSSKIWVLADDSGLVVDGLNGQPGVYSKRFVPGSDHDRNKEVLRRMADLKEPARRGAHFVSLFCLYQPSSKKISFFEGQVHGHLGFMEKGQNGFGYDTIFIPDGYDQTFGELSSEVKNAISHRAQAAQQLITFLEKELHD